MVWAQQLLVLSEHTHVDGKSHFWFAGLRGELLLGEKGILDTLLAAGKQK